MSQQINLFNPIFLKQEKHFSAMTMVQGLAIILLAALLLTAYTGYQLAALQREQISTTSQLQLAQSQLAKISVQYAPLQKDTRLTARLRRAEAEVNSLEQISDVLKKGEFGNTDGYADYLSAFARQIINGVWLTGFTIQGAGNEISIQGSALKPELVPVYLTRLKDEPVMQGASFATLEMNLPEKKKDQANGQSEKSGKQAVAAYINFNLHSSVLKENKDSLNAPAPVELPRTFSLEEHLNRAKFPNQLLAPAKDSAGEVRK